MSDLALFLAMLERAGVKYDVEDVDGAQRVYCHPSTDERGIWAPYGMLDSYSAALVFKDGKLVAIGALI